MLGLLWGPLSLLHSYGVHVRLLNKEPGLGPSQLGSSPTLATHMIYEHGKSISFSLGPSFHICEWIQ